MQKNNIQIKILLKIILVLVCIGIYGYASINTDDGISYNISIDTGNPLHIESPAEIAFVGDEGEKGFRIGPKIGRGWAGEAGGAASYKFYIPKDGKYHIWAYCLWYDVCANAVFVKIDDNEKIILGNDPVYKEWHWFRGFDIYLNRGTHDLELSNHSDHIAIQEIIFSNSVSTEPQMEGIVFSDIFYDGFDGCDQGNFSSWQQINGAWQVTNLEKQTEAYDLQNYLEGQSEDEAFITFQNNDWQDYSFNASIKVQPFDSSDCAIGICLGLTDPNNFNQVQIKPYLDSKKAKITVIDKQQVQISTVEKYIEISIGDSVPVKIETNEEITGGIGISLQGNITAYFDDIHVRKVINNN